MTDKTHRSDNVSPKVELEEGECSKCEGEGEIWCPFPRPGNYVPCLKCCGTGKC